MSLDRSLKSASSLVRHRNVLTRDERLDKLKELEKWDEKKSPLGLPKVAHRKMAVAKTVKEATEDGATPAAGAAPAAGAKGAAPAAKGAAPAAKGAAPAAKGAAPAAKGAAPAAKKK